MSEKNDGKAPPPAKVVGPNITGKREEYRLERKLQAGLFGGVYEAKGLSTGHVFAVKVLHRSELHKAQRASSLEFCEVPLSEIQYSDLMRGHKHVMQVEDNFEDQFCHYIVFELARGGDLLEALKLKPNGFEETQAQFLIGQAAKGLACLHERRLAMQDVSLENMLLNVLEDGQYQVKICDPGQAQKFDVDPDTGEEKPVQFHGFVGKSFRPPEIQLKQPYLATKVDAWCLGWSTFYLLAAQPLFLSADPAQQDADWELFERGEYAKLFRQKATSVSQQCMDFILKCLQIDPKKRMSIREALQHDWLRESDAKPMFAPKDIIPLPATPEKHNRDEPTPTGLTPNSAEAATPTAGGGSLNGRLQDETRMSGPSAPLQPGFRGGGLTGSLGGGLSAGGNFSSGGGPGGLGTATAGPSRSGQYSSVAPAWKMAPPSRPDSPDLSRPGSFYQGGGSAGTPTPNQYGPQARTSSPFGAAQRSAGYVSLHGRSPSRPPRQAAPLVRGGAATNVYGSTRESGSRSDIWSQQPPISSGNSQTSSHTPRATRVSGTGGMLPRGFIPTPQGGSSVTDASMEYGSSQLSTAPPEGQTADGQAQADGDKRFSGEILGGSGMHATAGTGGVRSNSPLPASVITMSRGMSPSPMRNLQGSQPNLQRSGSPMQQHGSSIAARNVSGQPSSIDAAGPQASPSGFWQSPRTASQSAGLFRQGGTPEAYSRGRAHSRSLSPSQAGLSPYGASPGGLMRGLSPTGGIPGRQGIAWSPVPPSPPAPTRSISPQPSSILVAGHNNSVSSLRWPDRPRISSGFQG